LRLLAKNAARPWGFTLVELLTVIAIIAVLATLVSASLGNAQRKGRKAVSTSNLRQIAIAFNLYLDDRDKRPETFRQLTETKYINERVLLCPEDKVVMNWAGSLEKLDSGRKPAEVVPGRGGSAPVAGNGSFVEDVAHSYFKAFDYYDEIWNQIDKSAMGGLAACQLHGIGRQRKGEPPSIAAYQGLVLRVLKDGSVVSRQVFWDGFSSTVNSGDGLVDGSSNNGTNAPPTSFPGTPEGGTSQLPLFLDAAP
jgi:prepilin-type N-terminal cleavage/methylation domain-containing protein